MHSWQVLSSIFLPGLLPLFVERTGFVEMRVGKQNAPSVVVAVAIVPLLLAKRVFVVFSHGRSFQRVVTVPSGLGLSVLAFGL